MKPCEHCQRAMQSVWYGGYGAFCTGCIARSCARSLDAFNALSTRGSGDKHPLRLQIERRMWTTDFETARKEVWKWWQRDHAQP